MKIVVDKNSSKHVKACTILWENISKNIVANFFDFLTSLTSTCEHLDLPRHFFLFNLDLDFKTSTSTLASQMSVCEQYLTFSALSEEDQRLAKTFKNSYIVWLSWSKQSQTKKTCTSFLWLHSIHFQILQLFTELVYIYYFQVTFQKHVPKFVANFTSYIYVLIVRTLFYESEFGSSEPSSEVQKLGSEVRMTSSKTRYLFTTNMFQ